MAIDRQTSEPFRMTGGRKPGNGKVVDAERIVAVQGKAFYERFMMGLVAPRRAELVAMTWASMVREGRNLEDLNPEWICERVDDLLEAELRSFEQSVGRYYKLYMETGKMNDLLKTAIEEAQDYSL